jgi:rod shape-determining protein MreC
MFSKRLLTIFCLILFALINIILLSVSAKRGHSNSFADRIVLAAIAPFQGGVTASINFCEEIWEHYFWLVSTREEYDRLKTRLDEMEQERSRYIETEHTCQRLRKLLGMKNELGHTSLAAQVIGVDPSGWFHSILIDAGSRDGVFKGMPVVVPEGVVGQVVKVSFAHSKVMLMIDRSSAIDALVQRTRARGIVEGKTGEYCSFKYALRKDPIHEGDVVVSSGLDGVFPKGLRIGAVRTVAKSPAGIFQSVEIEPFVDFAKLEEVLVITDQNEQG